MAYDLGTARGVIEMEYNGRGVAQAEKDVATVGKSTGKTRDALNKTANTAGVAGAAVAGGLALAVNAAADFESRMSAVGAVSGASEKQLGALSDKALQLGKDTQFSASESASAIEELVKAGLSVEDVLNGAADATVNLAAAGEIGMPEAATIASNAMNQFNLTAEDMVGVVDNIAGASNASAIDVSDFGQSLSQVGAVAHLAGVSFDDTATAIAIMGNAGIKGSDAGTSLKSMFSRLIPTTKEAKDLMKEMGLMTKDGSNQFYDAKGNMKGLADISQTLKNSLKGMTKEQKQAALQTLFGADAIRAAAVLSDSGAKGFNKMAKSMKKVSAADVAKKRMDNFNGSLEQMKGSLETAGITLGQVLLPPLRRLVDMVTQALNWFLNLNPNLQKFIAITLSAVAAILLIIAAIIKVTFFIKDLMLALDIIKIAMAETWLAALGPIALIIIAIIAIIAVVVILWKKSETFRKIVIAVWNAIKAAAQAVGNWFANTLPGLFKAAWDAIKDGVDAALGFLKAHWKTIIAIFLGPIGIVAALIIKNWDKIVGAIKDGITNVLDAVRGMKDRMLGFFAGAGTWLYDAGKDVINGLIDGIKSMGGAIQDAIKAAAGKFAKFLPGSPVQEGPLTVLNRGHAGKRIVEMVIEGLESMARPYARTVEQVITAPTATPGVGTIPGPRRPTANGPAVGLHLVSGRLSIDESGRAYITGIAREVADDNRSYGAGLKRMGRRK